MMRCKMTLSSRLVHLPEQRELPMALNRPLQHRRDDDNDDSRPRHPKSIGVVLSEP